MYTPADDWSRLKWPGEVKVILLEVAKECRGGAYMTIDELEPHGKESLEFLVNDELFYHEEDDGEVDGNLLLMTPSSFMSPTREAPASLSPVDPIGLPMDNWSRNIQTLLNESPRRRRIDDTMRVTFLSTLPEEEW